MNYIHHYMSPVGPITLASDGDAITGLWFDDQKYFAATISGAVAVQNIAVFDCARMWLDIYFSGRAPDFTPPVCMCGGAFRRAVWRELMKIPFGHTVTYGQIATKIAADNDTTRACPRAVGGAVGHNPISLIIPCHRVIGANGHITGYAGGIDRKIKLLQMEGVIASDTWP